MPVLATLDDYKRFTNSNDAPDNVEFLLTIANDLIYHHIQHTYNSGLARHVVAATNAVCAQVMYWVTSNISPADLSTGFGYSLGDLSVTKDGSTPTNPTAICPLALSYLRGEYLTYKGVISNRG